MEIGQKVLFKKGYGYTVGQNFYRAKENMIGIVTDFLGYNEIYVKLEGIDYNAKCIFTSLEIID
jgi:hypothetical protein